MPVTGTGVPGQSTAVALPDPGMATVGKLVLLDARPPRSYSPEQQQEALAKLERKAGPAAAAIESAVATAFDALRAELSTLAGGQASARVMIMIRNAELTQLAAELQASISRGTHGNYIEGTEAGKAADEGRVEKGLRSLAGICAVANDLLSKAYEAAREEAKANKGSATEQLMGRLGVLTQTEAAAAYPGGTVEDRPDSPFSPPGGVAKGPLTASPPIPVPTQEPE